MKYKIGYGARSLSLEVPQERVAAVLAPRAVEEVADVAASVEASLRRPFGSRPLAEILDGKKTALMITVDNTRPSPAMMLLPVVRLCRRHRVAPSVIIATGRHRMMTRSEIRSHLGEEIVKTCRVLQHNPYRSERMVLRGVTRRGTPIRVNRAIFEHDVVIGIGIIEPSYLSGWSGGRKLLMPGLSHHESIDNNHFYLTHPDTKIGRLHGNPVSDDAAEFAAELPFHFILYSVSGPDDEVVKIVSGDPLEAHEKGCALCERIYKVRTKRAGIVISSAGGAPYDCDLVQGKKAIIPAIRAVKRNGVIILCAECPEGLGAEGTFVDWLKNKTPLQVVTDVLDRKKFSLGAHGANLLAKPIVEKNAKVILVTCAEVAGRLKGSYVTALTRLSDAWKLAGLIAGRDSSVIFIEKARRLILC